MKFKLSQNSMYNFIFFFFFLNAFVVVVFHALNIMVLSSSLNLINFLHFTSWFEVEIRGRGCKDGPKGRSFNFFFY